MCLSSVLQYFKLNPKTLTGSLLVAGTCIGGGMLALPVAAAKTGFMPTLFCMTIVWAMMTVTAHCLVEIGFWMKKGDAHVMTMARSILGDWGKWFVAALFLFISYASLTAYIAGCSHLLSETLLSFGGIQISTGAGCLLITLLFGPFLVGPRTILGKTNDILFILMLIVYGLIIAKGFGHVDSNLLLRQDWSAVPLAVPLLITAFSFQTMVPSLHPFLDHDRRSLHVAIVVGTLIAFCVYALWQTIVFGSVPLEGQYGLLYAFERDMPATFSLSKLVHSEVVARAADLFALFALLTSFFGIGMGLVDFLGDGLQIKRKGKGALILGLLALVPSLIFAISLEKIFIMALDISGGFGDTILNGILPVAMLLVGYRYFAPKHIKAKLHIFGYYVLMLLFAVAFFFEAMVRSNSK